MKLKTMVAAGQTASVSIVGAVASGIAFAFAPAWLGYLFIGLTVAVISGIWFIWYKLTAKNVASVATTSMADLMETAEEMANAMPDDPFKESPKK